MNIDALIIIVKHITCEIQHDYDKLRINFKKGRITELKEAYHFIPSNEFYIKWFLEILDKEKVKKDDKIIDAGCGVSPILITLGILNYTNLHGIDLFQPYLDKLKNLIIHPHNLSNQNIFDYDYSNCKVIYSFRPSKEKNICIKFYKKVINELSINSFIVDFYPPLIDKTMQEYLSTIDGKKFEIINSGVKRIK